MPHITKILKNIVMSNGDGTITKLFVNCPAKFKITSIHVSLPANATFHPAGMVPDDTVAVTINDEIQWKMRSIPSGHPRADVYARDCNYLFMPTNISGDITQIRPVQSDEYYDGSDTAKFVWDYESDYPGILVPISIEDASQEYNAFFRPDDLLWVG